MPFLCLLWLCHLCGYRRVIAFLNHSCFNVSCTDTTVDRNYPANRRLPSPGTHARDRTPSVATSSLGPVVVAADRCSLSRVPLDTRHDSCFRLLSAWLYRWSANNNEFDVPTSLQSYSRPKQVVSSHDRGAQAPLCHCMVRTSNHAELPASFCLCSGFH